jgi:RNA polymerase sigma-70 factor (ECF subfamily)
LLAQVQAALDRGDGATALRRLDERASVDRRLLAERRAARILALCQLGRTQEAEQSALAFVREHPSSVQRTAVERSCAGKATEPR